MEAFSTSRSSARAIAKIGHRAKRTSPQDVKPFAKRQKNGASKAEMSRLALQVASTGPLEPSNREATENSKAGLAHWIATRSPSRPRKKPRLFDQLPLAKTIVIVVTQRARLCSRITSPGRGRMSSFRFLHAADIHLDSPLRGLSRYEGLPADRLRRATRDAFDNLIDIAIKEKVDFVVIAGDLFDGDWKDMSTGLYFARAMGRLAETGVRVFVLKGNHDADCAVTRSLPWPDNVIVFSSQRAETHDWPELGAALHGRSFPTAAVKEDLSAGYPPPIPGRFNIGVLHTALGGYAQHQTYAPCTLPALIAKGYDYWALGHVHAREVLHKDPWIVFPGNLQGRHAHETGVKGATLVDVEDGRVLSARALALDVVRWVAAEVDCTNVADMSEVHTRVRRRLTEVRAAQTDNRAAVVRVILTGETPLAGRLSDRRDALREDVCAIAEALEELWIEKLILGTRPPAAQALGAADDAISLLEEALSDPALPTLLEADLKPFLDSVPLDACEPEGLQATARDGRLHDLLAAASLALRARLTAGPA